MSDKLKIASVRPSPLVSILGVVGTIVMLIFGFFFMSGIPEGTKGASGFMLIWALVGLASIVYFLVNLISFSKSPPKNIPITAEEVIEVATNGQETSGDFETKLRKIEALKKDGLLST